MESGYDFFIIRSGVAVKFYSKAINWSGESLTEAWLMRLLIEPEKAREVYFNDTSDDADVT